MWKATRAIVFLPAVVLVLQGPHLAAQAQTAALPELPPAVQTAVCQNDWVRAMQEVDQATSDPAIATDYQAQLFKFRTQLKNWQTSGATVSNLPGCRNIAATRPPALPVNSAPLDFEAALRSLQAQRSLPYGFIRYEGLQGIDFTQRGCWVVDQRGRRLDLSALCTP